MVIPNPGDPQRPAVGGAGRKGRDRRRIAGQVAGGRHARHIRCLAGTIRHAVVGHRRAADDRNFRARLRYRPSGQGERQDDCEQTDRGQHGQGLSFGPTAVHCQAGPRSHECVTRQRGGGWRSDPGSPSCHVARVIDAGAEGHRLPVMCLLLPVLGDRLGVTATRFMMASICAISKPSASRLLFSASGGGSSGTPGAGRARSAR